LIANTKEKKEEAYLNFAVGEVELGEGGAGWVAPGDQERRVTTVKSHFHCKIRGKKNLL